MDAEKRPDPIEEIFEDGRKSGEMLVARFRLVILLIFIPLIFALRFFLGYILPSYWLFSIAKWTFMVASAAAYLWVLQRGWYRPWSGFLSLLFDTAFVTVSVITLSFFSRRSQGMLQDPLVILYYLISFTGGVRYDYKYTIFSIPLCGSAIVFIALADQMFHRVAVDIITLTDHLVFLLLISIIGMAFYRKLKDFIFSRYQMSERHMKEISSLLDIGRNISSPDKLARTLSNIAVETKNLLSADTCCVVYRNIPNGAIETVTDSGLVPDDKKEKSPGYLIGKKIIEGSRPLDIPVWSADDDSADTGIAAPDKKPALGAFAGLPVIVDGTAAGAVIAARNHDDAFSYHDVTLLRVLSEQAAISIKNARLLDELRNESVYLDDKLDHASGFQHIVGQSKIMKELYGIIEKAAQSTIPVLILGESGTGKELVADAIYSLGPRRDRPFVKINCSAIPSELLESELFGHEKGSFTGAHRQKRGKFEMAAGGTIFLDEIGDMGSGLQSKLLRVLQEGSFDRVGGESAITADVRIITATNQNLEEKIKRGEFREDLYYRINGLPVHLPPLRDRREDIPLLVEHFIKKHDYSGTRKVELTVSAMKFMTAQEWRGNVRELENLVHRLLVMSDAKKISEKDLKSIYTIPDSSRIMDFYSIMKDFIADAVRNGCDVAMEIERIEKEFFVEAMKQSKGNIRKAGEMTGVPKSTLFNKLQKYKINPE